jgi:hypothetical protein
MYQVQTWDDEFKCVRYHSVVDAIDYDDAADVVKGLYPNERLLGVTFSTVAEKVVEKPVEKE